MKYEYTWSIKDWVDASEAGLGNEARRLDLQKGRLNSADIATYYRGIGIDRTELRH